MPSSSPDGRSKKRSRSRSPDVRSKEDRTEKRSNYEKRSDNRRSSSPHSRYRRDDSHRRRYSDRDRPRDRSSGRSSRPYTNRSRDEHDSEAYSDRRRGYEKYRDSRQNDERSSDRYWSKYPDSRQPRSLDSELTSKEKTNDKFDDKENYSGRNSDKDNRQKNFENRNATNNVDEKNTNSASSQKKVVDMLTSRTGGAYIPPAKLRMMQAQITDKSSAAYQRIAWEALKKSIHGHINKVNTANIGIIVRELLRENIVRGRGLLCRSIIQAQAASPTFTHVYAALVAVINSKFPNIGELLLRRVVIQFRRGFKRNDKSICISSATFVAHLVNQRVAHEILALEILTLLVESPTDDSVEVAIAFLKECGMKLMEVSNKGMHAIFEMLRNILHEGQLDKRVQYMIEVIFQVRKDEFRDHKAVTDELDIVEEEDQFTHLITLEDAKDPEDILNVFKFDPEYETNEQKYGTLKKELLGEGSDDDSGSGSGSEEGSESDEESGAEEGKDETIIDNTETNLVALRRTIYLTIQSSLDFEECAHKLLRMELKPGQEMELCHMLLDCCAEQRTYEKFFGLLAQRFCQINKIFIPPFQEIFRDTYDKIHRLDTNKLRNVAKFFAHLFFTDAISWEVLSLIHLNEDETTSSSRIFIKILFQELAEYMGLTKLNERVKDATLQEAFDGLFPRDDPKNTRFAINFFTSIGLGGLTDELRDHLKSQPKIPILPQLVEELQNESSSDSSDSSDESSSSSSDDSSSESDESVKVIRKSSKKKPKKKKAQQKKEKRKKSKHKRKE